MSRISNSLILLCGLFVFVGLTPSVFAIDASSALKQSAISNESAGSLFDGQSVVKNLYSRSLRIVRQNESASTQQAIDSVVAYYLGQSCKIFPVDVINILSTSRTEFKSFFENLVAISFSINEILINGSYRRFFACHGWKSANPEAAKFTIVQNEVAALYYQSLQSIFLSSTLAQDNVGEDVFWNWSTDDSDFDLLVDINEVWNLFFTSTTIPPEVLFYKLPTISNVGGSSAWTTGGTPSSWSTDNNQPSWAKKTNTAKVNAVNPWTKNSISLWSQKAAIPELNPLFYSPPAPVSASNDQLPESSDTDVQQFLATTNPSSFSQSDYNFVVGDQCATAVPPVESLAAIQEETITPEEYYSWLMDFIDSPNIPDASIKILLSGFVAEYKKIAETYPNPDVQAEILANTYAEMAFGNGWDSSCNDTCLNLPIDEQMQCQVGCTKSCIATCDGLPVDEKILCAVQCSCFLISGPNGPGREKMGMNDMATIKFCTVPAQPGSIPQKKTVSGLQAIIQAIVDTLQWLKASWQTIKMKKTKEFLDLGIQLKLSEIINFKIYFDFKPIFAQKSDAAKKRQKILENKALSESVSSDSTPDTENYNRYVVVANPVQDNADLESSSLGTNNAESSFQAIADAWTKKLKDPIALYQSQKNALISEDVIAFLWAHQAFWEQTNTVLMNMLQDAIALKEKIQQQ